jgi:uncharacterized membrane protein YozB (DUF420 family)
VNWKKSILLWLLSLVLTLMVAIYQRMTGPTHPVRGKQTVKGETIQYRLLRSYTEFEGLPVQIRAVAPKISGQLMFRRYKTDDPWTERSMKREKQILKAEIPGQPRAGKVEYLIRVEINGERVFLNDGKPIVARFKGKVPTTFLIIHVILMFMGIWLALRTGIEALRKSGNFRRLVNWTLAVVFLGGMIFGPIVQKYAFGDFWTGFPFGIDLTDNKTLLAVIFWLAAFFLKKKSRWWVVAAAVLMLIVYLIPHSVLGSELDYNTGQMKNKYSVLLKDQRTKMAEGIWPGRHFVSRETRWGT